MLSCTFPLKSRSHFVLKFRKKQYEYCDYHIRRFLTSNFKWVKPRASEVVSIVSLQVDHFLALVCTLHFI